VQFLTLEISELRNLRSVSVSLDPGLNYFFGENGAGKTAVLEAVSLLARGRSFRTGQAADLISFGADRLTLRADVLDEHRGRFRIGLSRNKAGKTEVRLNGEPGRRLSEIARLLPVQVLLPSLSELVFGAPSQRREWLDWGLFHVKPGYLDGLRSYLQILRQRNAGLKSVAAGRLTRTELDVWTRNLATQGLLVHGWRSDYLRELAMEVNLVLGRLSPGLSIAFQYQGGWAEGESLEKVLSDSLPRDVKSGATSAGPHRADIEIRTGSTQGSRASAVLSRGQGKIVACAMVLGQAKLLGRLTNRSSVFLIDDLGAELDHEHSRTLFEILGEMSSQVLATSALAPETMRPTAVVPISMFHVEQGNVRRVGLRHD